MQRVLLTLAGAAQRAFREAGGTRNASNPADPYMTLPAYFNALRELGGGRRIIEEEVQNTLRNYGERKRINEDQGLFRDRRGASEVMELTSRVPTGQVAEARQRLNLRFGEKGCVAWAIATNMISVGLDIQRLGLMVVIGQPKTHSEYIQATNRVGRDDRRPGLVVTLLNIHKPRDRSHYERFRHYHETFYRSVEAASVTQSVAMRCGYPAASIRERVYVDSAAERYGVLLYTASADAEGTLGGLVEQARWIEDHLEAALDTAALCSNDPVCAHHEPGASREERWLHGAACHGCTLVAETSCEMQNDYLDRALVAPVIGSADAAFFRP